jgi:UDP-N-acetylmuramate--alanine ligase
MALVLLESGVSVSGSDRVLSPQAERVRQAGGKVYLGHHPENIHGAELVVRSSAVPDDHIEVVAARKANIQVLKRADFLPQLTLGKRVIAVAGTHGKTTTTAMIAWLLTVLGIDPTFMIGGVSQNLGTNAHAGKDDIFVVEADEYDRMFLGLSPSMAVITNIEFDHPDCYPTPLDFFEAFMQFGGRLVSGGLFLVCGDDPGAVQFGQEMLAQGYQALFYSVGNILHEYQAQGKHRNQKGGYDFTLLCRAPNRYNMPVQVSLQVPGEHNIRNALAALAVTDQLGLPVLQAARALGEFQGAARRFEIFAEVGGITLVDDYAHHPSEVRATLAAAEARFPGRPIWAVWQPHTYSRSRTLLPDFSGAFGHADHLIVLPIYAAREQQPMDGFSAHDIVKAIMHSDVRYYASIEETCEYLMNNFEPGAVVLVLSAGDADELTKLLNAELLMRRGAQDANMDIANRV